LDVFTEEIGVSLMDNCPSHVTDDVISLLTEEPMRVITFAPHTTQIFQVLDVTLFGVLKRRPRYELHFNGETETVIFIMKGYHDFKQTMVEPNIWGFSKQLDLSLSFIPKLSRIDCYSMRKSSDKL
jgi:hypothetical protein